MTSPTGNQPTTHTPAALDAFSWALVGVPLVFGKYQTEKTAETLCTG